MLAHQGCCKRDKQQREDRQDGEDPQQEPPLLCRRSIALQSARACSSFTRRMTRYAPYHILSQPCIWAISLF